MPRRASPLPLPFSPPLLLLAAAALACAIAEEPAAEPPAGVVLPPAPLAPKVIGDEDRAMPLPTCSPVQHVAAMCKAKKGGAKLILKQPTVTVGANEAVDFSEYVRRFAETYPAKGPTATISSADSFEVFGVLNEVAAQKNGKHMYTVRSADRAAVADLPEGPCEIAFETPCDAVDTPIVEDLHNHNVDCGFFDTQALCTDHKYRAYQCVWESSTNTCERITPCAATTSKKDCESDIHAGECMWSRGACHSKCAAVDDGRTLTSVPADGGTAVSTAAARALCESFDACFFRHGICNSKNPAPYSALDTSDLGLTRDTAIQGCDPNLGCTCARDVPAYTGKLGCLRVTNGVSTSGSKSGCPISSSGAACSYTLNVEDTVCETCVESQDVSCLTVAAAVDGRPNYWSINQAKSNSCGGTLNFDQHCSWSTSYTPCVGNPPAFSSFVGEWKLTSTSASQTFTLTTTSSSTVSDSWSLGLETTAEVGFGSSKLSATVSSNYEHSVETVLSQSQTVSCTSNCNDTNGAVYAYYIYGTPTATDTTEPIGVPANCLLECASPGNPRTPACPPGYCDGTYGVCDCCTSLAWAADPTDSSLPPLCTEGVDPLVDPTTHQDAVVPTASGDGTAPAA